MQVIAKNPNCHRESVLFCFKECEDIPEDIEVVSLDDVTNKFFTHRENPGELTSYEAFIIVVFLQKVTECDGKGILSGSVFSLITESLKIRLEEDFPILDMKGMYIVNTVSIDFVRDGNDGIFTELSDVRKAVLAGIHQANVILSDTLHYHCSPSVIKKMKESVERAHKNTSLSQAVKIVEELEELVREKCDAENN